MKRSEERDKARELGYKTYIGRSCLRCGENVRYVSGCGCVRCQNQRVKDHGKEASARYNVSEKGKATKQRHGETEKFLETGRARGKRQYSEDSDKFRHRNLWAKYGLSLEQYLVMHKDQDGCCYICKRHESLFIHRLAVDHNHTTGKVRKLLCGPCNKALGCVKENESTLINMIAYIREHHEEEPTSDTTDNQ